MLLELGKVNRAIIQENGTLIKETVNVLLEQSRSKRAFIDGLKFAFE